MTPSEHKKFTRYSPFVVMGVILLLVGVFATVISTQQSQDVRSHAAGATAGFTGTVIGDGHFIAGAVNGDVIGNRNIIAGLVLGCVRGNGNIIGGSVTGTVTGTGNILAGGFGTGPCLSDQETVPTPSITPIPTEGSSVTSTPIPTIIATTVPTQVAPTVYPTSIPAVTVTPTPVEQEGSTQVKITLLLHGIGKGGDSVNPNSQGNPTPLRPHRTVSVDFYDSQNQLVVNKQGTVAFDSASGTFSGTIDMGATFATGVYTIKIKTDQYLRGLVSGIQTITNGQTTTLNTVTLIAGDINNDNAVNIVDYNILVGCYSDLLPPVSCTDANTVLADLNDDGHVNQFDYNLFIRELTNIGGQ